MNRIIKLTISHWIISPLKLHFNMRQLVFKNYHRVNSASDTEAFFRSNRIKMNFYFR